MAREARVSFTLIARRARNDEVASLFVCHPLVTRAAVEFNIRGQERAKERQRERERTRREERRGGGRGRNGARTCKTPVQLRVESFQCTVCNRGTHVWVVY